MAGRPAPDASARHRPDTDAAADRRQRWSDRAREIDRLNLSDPRAGLALAEAWVAEGAEGEGRARALKALAYALRCAGYYDRADTCFLEAERAFTALNLEDEAARVRIGHVEALRYLGRYDDAIALATANLAYLQSRSLELDAARQTINLGIVHWRRGDLHQALDCFRQVRALAHRIDQSELAATASMNVGIVLIELGRYGEALRASQYAARRFRVLGLGERLATVEMNLGLLHIGRGEYGRALDALGRSRSLCVQLGLDQKRAAVDLDLTRAYLALNLHVEAEESSERAAETLRQLDLPFELATALLEGGHAAARRGEHALARERIEEARSLYERIGNAAWEVVARLAVLRVEAETIAGEDAEALERLLAAARDTAERLGALDAPDHAAGAHLLAGDALARLGRTDEARTYYRAALALGDLLESDGILYQACAAEGRILELSAPDEARACYERAVEHLERLRARARADDLRLAVVAGGARLYERIAVLLLGSVERPRRLLEPMAANEPSEVQHQAENGKHRPWPRLAAVAPRRVDATSPPSRTEVAAPSPPAPTHGRRGISSGAAPLLTRDGRAPTLARAAEMSGARSAELHPSDDAAGRAAFRWLERGKSRGLLEETLGVANRRYGRDAARIRRARERVAELRSRLNASYSDRFSGESGRVGTPIGEDVAHLERELTRATRDLQILLRGDNAIDIGSLVEVERVQAALGPEDYLVEYLVVDDEVACFVVGREVFEVRRALAGRTEVEEATSWLSFQIRKGDFGAAYLRTNQRMLAPAVARALGRLGDLLLAPLADVLERVDRLVIVPHGPLHGVPVHALTYDGGPLLNSVTVSYAPSGAVYAASVERRERRVERPLIVAPDVEGLPWVGEEAERIAALFPRASVLMGRRATLAELRRQAAAHDTLHLATHGIFRADNPTFSALELADGWLSVAELAELGGGQSLICLSACHTARNGIGPGDELLGLTRAVLGTGSAALIASLWAANDETAPSFMAELYAGLREGRGRAASLREAARLTREREPHPYFWAPFVLVGAP
ncbi:MAG: CHAT domain-containing protein [Chloroflexi bacterium]|nr:CHAT domain-containing protein [Chloroflexota bacterium]